MNHSFHLGLVGNAATFPSAGTHMHSISTHYSARLP